MKRAQVPQSCSLTLRNRNPNQIVRLHFMHQNWPKRVIETSIWDIECSNPSKYHKFALILVIFSNICPTKRLPWTLTEWVCVPEVEINDCIAYYMVLFNFLHKNLKSTVFYRKNENLTVFFVKFHNRECLVSTRQLITFEKDSNFDPDLNPTPTFACPSFGLGIFSRWILKPTYTLINTYKEHFSLTSF